MRLAYSRTEEEFEKIYKQATDKAASMGLDLPSEVPGQSRRRKVPEKFKFAATSATTDHAFPTLQEYYCVKVYYVFVDTMIQELQRRFKGGDNSIWEILHGFHCLVVPENWKTASIPTAAHQAVKKLCHFYNIKEEDKLLTELKVFHTSYSCPPPVNVSSILSAVKENNAQLVPTWLSCWNVPSQNWSWWKPNFAAFEKRRDCQSFFCWPLRRTFQ